MQDESKPVSKQSDEDLLEEMASRLRLCEQAESDNRTAALDDLEFLDGKQWPEHIRMQRDKERRPCLTINTLPTYLHQVTNDLRQNKTSIKVHPVDDKADPATAEVLQGLIRHIEYSSGADVAYDTAGTSAAAIGFGFFRILTDYEGPDSFDQEIKFCRIRNPMTVYLDPFRMQPDGSDARFAVLYEDEPREEFKRKYPDASASSVMNTEGLSHKFNGWLDADTVRVVEYYRIVEEQDTLCLLKDGSTVWKSEYKAKAKPVQERKSARKTVEWIKCTAKDVLERTEVPCEWIPVFEVVGEEIDLNGKVSRKGVLRNAKDPARMYNVWMTAATEEIGMRTKSPWVMAEGQDEGHEAEWATANVLAHSSLKYKPVSTGGQLAPPPQRQPMSDVPAGVLAMAMHARDDIKATTGLFDSSMGAKGSATSGKQEIAQQHQGQVTNFHFADNLARTVRHAGRCIMSMIPRIYDTQRIVRILGEDETPSHAELNKPLAVPMVDKKTGAIRKVLNDLSVGRYDVTVSTGPAFSTMRAEAAEQMQQIGSSFPKLMDVAGDKMVKAMNWPDADVIAERLKRTLPPGIADGEDGQEAPQVPPEVQQQLEQYDQALNDAMAQIEQLQKAQQDTMHKAQTDAQAKVEVARINAMADIEAKRVVAEVQAMSQPQEEKPVEAEEAGEQEESASSQALMMVAQAIAMQAQAASAPKRKVMRIQAPSGGVYEGEVVEMTEEQDNG